MAESGLEIRLASRPKGWPELDNFEVAEVPVPEPAEGQLLVRNLVMSVDPYMRGRMNEGKSYVPPFELGKPLDGIGLLQWAHQVIDGVVDPVPEPAKA